MSGATARARATSRPAYVREDVRPLLTVVKANQPRRSVIPMTFVALVMIAIAIVVPMLINTHMAQTSYQIREYQIQLNELEAQSWTLQMQLQEKASPVELEKAAKAQGMVHAGKLGTIRLADGQVEGGVAAR